MERVTPRPSPALRCAYCHGPAEDAAACPSCGTLVHAGCSVEVGVCPTLGCGRGLSAAQRPKRSWVRQLVIDGAVALAVYLVLVSVGALTRPRVDWGDRARQHASRGER